MPESARRRGSLRQWNLMHPIRWVPEDAQSLLDVGCHVGAFLRHCRDVSPTLQLSGVEIDLAAIEKARQELPDAELHHAGAEELPFDDARFDCVTCIEVLEHIPAERRREALTEVRRVLKRGGRLILRTPHAGLFGFLDPHNLRFRFPALYRGLVGRGERDAGYEAWSHGVVWHHHFRRAELVDLLGDGWRIETWRRGGLLLAPLVEIARWPFYRKGRADHPLCLALDALFAFDLGLLYGPAAYDILLVARKT